MAGVESVLLSLFLDRLDHVFVKVATLLVMELPESADVSMGVDRAVVDVNDEQPDVQFLLAHCCSFASMVLLGRSS